MNFFSSLHVSFVLLKCLIFNLIVYRAHFDIWFVIYILVHLACNWKCMWAYKAKILVRRKKREAHRIGIFSPCYSLTSAWIIVMDVPICSNISFGGLFTVIKTNVQRQWIASILNNDYNSNQMIMTLLREHATKVVTLFCSFIVFRIVSSELPNMVNTSNAFLFLEKTPNCYKCGKAGDDKLCWGSKWKFFFDFV